MALSGSFSTNSYDGRCLTFSWTATQSTANNTSTISWSLKGDGAGGSDWYYSAPFKVVIAGDTVYESSTRIKLFNGTSVASGTKTITHNNDGSKSFTASAEGAIYSYAVNCTGSGSWSLNQIPRKATIYAAPNFNDEANPTITYSNLAGNNVTSLKACISLTGAADDIAYRDIPKTGTSYTFNLTTAERNVLRNATTTANSRKVRFYVQTVIGGETYLSYLEKTLTIVNANPTLNPTITDSNTTITNLTGDSNILVKYYSNAKITTGAAALKGATIKSQKITCGNKSLTANGTINAVESGTFTFTVTDSRGNTTTKTVTKSFVNYLKPTVNLSGSNISTTGALTVKINGLAYNGTIGATSNANYQVQYCYNENGGSYTSWKGVTYTYTGNNYNATVNLTGLNYQSAYKFKARIIDKLNTVTTEEVEIIAKPVFEWGKDMFSVNAKTVEGNILGLYGL